VRILQISDVYFPRVGGVSTSISTFLQAFRERGHHVTLIVPDYEVAEPDDGIVRMPSRRVPFDPEDRMMKTRTILALAEWLSAEAFDLLHIQTPFVAHYAGLALARRLGLPVIETYHTFFEEYLYHYVPFAPRAAMRSLVRQFSRHQCNSVDHVIVPSSAMTEVLRQYGVRRPIHVIPTGIDAHRFDGGDGACFRRSLEIAPEQPMLLYLGRVAHEKNIDFLFDVLQEVRIAVPDTLLVVAGEGPAEAHLRALAGRMGLAAHVRFVGYLDRESALLDAYRAADCFVFASRTETQGLVLLEAMASGLPVVALAAMGTIDVLATRRAAVAAPDDPRGFAQHVVNLLRNPVERARLGAEGKANVRKWSATALADRVLELYGEVRGAGGVRIPAS
jgi:glycosyltransferase involved in cell wall biosynthesis